MYGTVILVLYYMEGDGNKQDDCTAGPRPCYIRVYVRVHCSAYMYTRPHRLYDLIKICVLLVFFSYKILRGKAIER